VGHGVGRGGGERSRGRGLPQGQRADGRGGGGDEGGGACGARVGCEEPGGARCAARGLGVGAVWVDGVGLFAVGVGTWELDGTVTRGAGTPNKHPYMQLLQRVVDCGADGATVNWPVEAAELLQQQQQQRQRQQQQQSN